MALVSQSMKNFKGGISQQPDVLRYSDQGARQVNGFSSEVEGLQKRPPSVHVKRLGNTRFMGEKPMCHIINRDESERYSVFFTGSDIKVFDLFTGDELTVNAPDGKDYINTANPRDDLRAVTVADFTFVVNRKVSPEEGTEIANIVYPLDECGIIMCKGGQYGRTFRVHVNNTQVAAWESPLGDQVAHAKEIDISNILGNLNNQIKANLAGWTSEVRDGYIFLRAPEGTKIEDLRVEDGFNGTLLSCFINDAQKTTDLPTKAPHRYQVRISGEAGTGQDDYWLMYDAERLVWTETVKPGLTIDIEKSTMPHVLVREADGTFTFRTSGWGKRRAGDDDTNPYPSFIGETINDVFFFRNRLGFLAGENVILSEAGQYFNFFPNSVAVLNDADMIDVAVSTNRVSILKYAVPFAEELLLWSDQSQFVMYADGILTATSTQLNLTTEFEVSEKARPFGIGRGVYFVSPRAKYSSIRRYYAVQDVTQVKNAEDISAHVPSYIPNGVFNVRGSATENFVTVLTEGAPNHIYIYKFLYLEELLAQQSWSHWDFGEGVRVLGCEMIGAVMHILLDTPSGVFLEKVEFTQNTTDFDEEPYRLFMDRKYRYGVPASAFNNDEYTTTINLADLYGAMPESGDYFAVADTGVVFEFPCPTGGWAAEGGKLVLDGDLSGTTMFIGEKYCFEYEFSKFLIKSQDSQGGTTTEDIGRLQLRRAWVNYDRSGYFRIEVTNQGRTSTYTMTGKRTGTAALIIGEETLDTGQMRFPIAGNAQIIKAVLKADGPNPVSIIGGGWEGNYVRRSSGI